jgi:hypothetical protein
MVIDFFYKAQVNFNALLATIIFINTVLHLSNSLVEMGREVSEIFKETFR